MNINKILAIIGLSIAVAELYFPKLSISLENMLGILSNKCDSILKKIWGDRDDEKEGGETIIAGITFEGYKAYMTSTFFFLF